MVFLHPPLTLLDAMEIVIEVAVMDIDLTFVRAQFPAFSEPSLQGQCFFENAGGSYACQQVIDRLQRFYTQRKVQPYGPYAASRQGGEEMDEARSRLAALLGVATEELSFGPSTTQNVYVLAQAFGEWLTPGDAIIVTNQDHEANTGAWRRLGENGIEIREWAVDAQTGHLDPARLDDLLDGKVRLLCFPHCSNVIGEINDVAAITAKAHAAGAVVCVDGVSYAPHGLPDVGAIGADIYMFSAYKTYGPHQGIMTIRRDLGMRLPNQAHDFNAGSLYKRFTPAGPDHAQIAACAGIADYVEALHSHHGGDGAAGPMVHNLMRAHEVRLLQPLLDYVSEKNSVRLLGPDDAARRAPTVALELQNQTPSQAAEALAEHGIMAGGGDFYAGRALKAVNVNPETGVLRISFVHYNSKGEVDRLIEVLDHVLQ